MKRKLFFFTFSIILVFSLELLSCSKKNKWVKVDDKEKPSKVLDDTNVDEGHSSDALVGEGMPDREGMSGREGMSEGEEMPGGEEMPEGEDLPDDEEVIDEEKRIASEIGDLEKDLSDSEKPKEEEIFLKIITDKDNQLGFMEYGDELLIPQKSDEGFTLVHSSKNKLERNFYDVRHRLKKKEIWNYKDYESAKLKESYTYLYLNDTFTLLKTVLDTEQNQTIYEYGPDGLLENVQKFFCKDENKYLISEKHIIYYDDKRIAEEESKDYSYSENYKKRTDTFQKKYKYFYNDEGIPPDLEYLENGELKLKTKYSSEKGTYTSQIFFSDDISVKSYYEKNFRVKDVYYNKMKVVRVRNYEKNDISEF